MSWIIGSTPGSLCQWKPWIDAGIHHGMVGLPFDFGAGNRERSLREFPQPIGSPLPQPYRWLRQTHSTTLYGLSLPEEQGIPPYAEGESGDGFVFRFGQPEGTLAITTADCLSMVIRGGEWGALVHAGWRGLASGIVEKAALVVAALSGQPVEVVIFPHASAARYEVGEEVIQTFRSEVVRYDRSASGRWLLDLANTARASIEQAGVAIAGWHSAPACTIDDCRWHSYRREGSRSNLTMTGERNMTFVSLTVEEGRR